MTLISPLFKVIHGIISLSPIFFSYSSSSLTSHFLFLSFSYSFISRPSISWSSHLFFELGALRIVSSLEVSALDFASWGRRSETRPGLWLESFPGPPSMLSPGLPRKIKGSKRMRLVSTFHMSWPLHDEPLKVHCSRPKGFCLTFTLPLPPQPEALFALSGSRARSFPLFSPFSYSVFCWVFFFFFLRFHFLFFLIR